MQLVWHAKPKTEPGLDRVPWRPLPQVSCQGAELAQPRVPTRVSLRLGANPPQQQETPMSDILEMTGIGNGRAPHLPDQCTRGPHSTHVSPDHSRTLGVNTSDCSE